MILCHIIIVTHNNMCKSHTKRVIKRCGHRCVSIGDPAPLYTLSGDFVCMFHCYESWLLFITLWLYCVIQLSWVISVRQRICRDTCLSSASSPTSLRALKKMSPNITSNTSKSHSSKLTLTELWPTLSLSLL